VRAVDVKTNKITVAWGGGPESQHDVDEIMPVPFFGSVKTASMMAADQTDFVEPDMESLLCRQVGVEFYSAYLYYMIAAICQSKGLVGFQAWFERQGDDEIDHAMKVYKYLVDTGSQVVLPEIPSPDVSPDAEIAELAQTVLDHEMSVTKDWQAIGRLSKTQDNAATCKMVQDFMDEQIEEEDAAVTLCQKVQLADSGSGILLVDNDLKDRDPNEVKASSWKQIQAGLKEVVGKVSDSPCAVCDAMAFLSSTILSAKPVVVATRRARGVTADFFVSTGTFEPPANEPNFVNENDPKRAAEVALTCNRCGKALSPIKGYENSKWRHCPCGGVATLKPVVKRAFDDDDDEEVTCPWCHADQMASECLLGGLGSVLHYRCRYCGGQWSHSRKRSGNTIKATGEMGIRDLQPGGEHYEWAEDIKRAAKRIQSLTRGLTRFQEMRPFDVYQGPYAQMNNAKLWSDEREGKYFFELFQGGSYGHRVGPANLETSVRGSPDEIADWLMEYHKNASAKMAASSRVAAAGPLTLLMELQTYLNQGRLDDEKWLKTVGYGWGHTPGVDYIFGDAGTDIAYALIGFASGHKSQEETLRVVRQNIHQAIRENEPFRGMTGESPRTHELWMQMMNKKLGRVAAAKEVQFLRRDGSVFATIRDAKGAFDLWKRGQHDVVVEGEKYKAGDFRGREAIEKLFGEKYRLGSDSDFSGLRSRRAMYWCAPDRTYRLTQQEQTNGTAVCPQCKGEMSRERFTRSDKLLVCPGCGFKIPTSKAVKQIEVKVPAGVSVEVTQQDEAGNDVAGQNIPAASEGGRGRKAGNPVTPEELVEIGRMELSQIAYLVYRDWKNVYFGAKPYLEAMSSLRSVSDMYMADSGTSIVAYFLANANTWRGEVAKAVKKELNRRIRR
jgi:ferritin